MENIISTNSSPETTTLSPRGVLLGLFTGYSSLLEHSIKWRKILLENPLAPEPDFADEMYDLAIELRELQERMDYDLEGDEDRADEMEPKYVKALHELVNAGLVSRHLFNAVQTCDEDLFDVEDYEPGLLKRLGEILEKNDVDPVTASEMRQAIDANSITMIGGGIFQLNSFFLQYEASNG